MKISIPIIKHWTKETWAAHGRSIRAAFESDEAFQAAEADRQKEMALVRARRIHDTVTQEPKPCECSTSSTDTPTATSPSPPQTENTAAK